MEIEIVFTHENLPKRDYQGKTAVVIDVLRATSSITAALMNGAVSVIPVNEPAEAFSLRKHYNYLLAGERDGLIIDGFDFGNSPLEFTPEKVKDKTIVLTGAMIPYKFGSSDGLFNLGSAIALVQTLPPGVYIAMNGRYFNWDNCQKNRDKGEFEEIKPKQKF